MALLTSWETFRLFASLPLFLICEMRQLHYWLLKAYLALHILRNAVFRFFCINRIIFLASNGNRRYFVSGSRMDLLSV